MRDQFILLPVSQKLSSCLVAVAMMLVAGCAGKPMEVEPAAMTFPEPQRQYICVSDIYFGDTARAHVLSDGTTDVPVGDWLARLSGARFWTDSALKASGKPQPKVTAGFAQGTGVRAAEGFRDVEVQIVVQFQIMKPTGNAYYDLVGGRASGHSIGAASAQALGQALDRFESVLLSAGICRQVQ